MTEMTMVPMILLAIAVACAAIFEFVLPDSTPGGFVISSGVASLGAWLGSAGLWHFGPDVVGVPLLPTAICSILTLFLFAVMCDERSRQTWD